MSKKGLLGLKNKEKIYFAQVVLIAFIIFLIIVGIVKLLGISKSTNEIGDSLGGTIGVIFNFFGAILVYKALKSQIKANKIITNQFVIQQQKEYLQNFENTFYNLLSIHHQIIESIDFKCNSLFNKKNDENILEYLNNNTKIYKDIVKDIAESREYQSRDVFKFSFSVLYNLLRDEYISKEIIKRNVDANVMNQFESIGQFYESTIELNNMSDNNKFNQIYLTVYDYFNTDFGHYFRNLYRIVKIIDSKTFSDDYETDFKIKYEYTSIVRAQLSDDETKWLFFNCLSNLGKDKFKPLLEKYSMLKIVDCEDELFDKYCYFYSESAFKRI